MKIKAALSWSLALILLAGCTRDGSGEAGPAPTAEKTPESIYYFETDGTEIRVNRPAEEIRGLTDKAKSVYEMPLCGLEGKELTYDMGHYEVDIIETEEYSKVYSVVFTDDAVTTREGIYIGETAEKVIETYGEPDEREDNSITYTDKDSKLVFIMQGGNVCSIQYCSSQPGL